MGATTIGGILGAGIGLAVSGGNPAAAMKGFQIGAAVGSIVDAATSSNSAGTPDLRYGGSTYGASIPRVWVSGQVAGQVIWAAKDQYGQVLTQTSSGGGSGGGSGGPHYSITCAVKVCAGTITMPDGTQVTRNPVIKRIWADDMVVYDSSAPGTTLLTLGGNLAIYAGTESQAQDPTILASMGATLTPAYLGDCYFVVTGMDCYHQGNRVPSWRIEVCTDACSVGTTFSDIARAAGLAAAELNVTSATVALQGLVQTDRVGGDAATAAMLRAYAIDLCEVDGTLLLVPRGGASVATFTLNDLGATMGDSAPANSYYQVTRRLVRELPGRLEVTYFDKGQDFLQGMAADQRRQLSVPAQLAKQVPLPLVLSNDDGQAIVSRMLDEEWLEADLYEWTCSYKWLTLAPGDPVTFPLTTGNRRLRITRMTLPGVGEVGIEAVPDNLALYGGAAIGSGTQAPRVSSSQAAAIVPTQFLAWSGLETSDADQAAPGFYVAATGANGWKGGTIYYSSDSGATWQQAGSVSTRATFGTTTSILSSAGAAAGSFDNVNTVGVSIGTGLLGSTSDSLITAGSNRAVCGGEIFGFGTVSLTGVGLYTLSHIMRGYRSSPMSGHASGENFIVITSDVVRISVPVSLVGTSVQVKVVSPGQTIGAVTAQTITIAAATPTALASRVGQLVAPNWLSSAQTFTPTIDGSWHTLSPTGIPAGAVAIMVDGWTYNAGNANNVDLELDFRSSSSSSLVIVGARNRGVNGTYSGEQAFDKMVPCSGSQTFDYQFSSGTVTTATALIRVIGYWA